MGWKIVDDIIVRCVIFSIGWKIFKNVIIVRCLRFSMSWNSAGGAGGGAGGGVSGGAIITSTIFQPIGNINRATITSIKIFQPIEIEQIEPL